ncbi:MAG: hypothetical protein LUG55_08620 [Clostridiales bacterium]|nr:hypothetical protein [Clostridiales bacterium]
MMEYEKLPPALQQWCDQAASRAAEEEQYQVRREVSLRAYQRYTALCADHDPEQAENLTLHALGSPYEATRQREGKNAKAFLTTAIVVAAAVAVWDVVFMLMLRGWEIMLGPQGARVAVGMVPAHLAAIALLISAVSYYRKVRRSERPGQD